MRTQIENDSLKSRINELEIENSKLKETANTHYIKAIECIKDSNLTDAMTELNIIIDKYPIDPLADASKKRLNEIDVKIKEVEKRQGEEEYKKALEQKYLPLSATDAVKQWKLFRNDERKYVGTVTTWKFKCKYISNGKPNGELPKDKYDIGNYYEVFIEGTNDLTYGAAAMLGKFPKIVSDDWVIVTGKFTEVTSSGKITLRPIKVVNLGYRGYNSE